MGDILDLQTALDALEKRHINVTKMFTGVVESIRFMNEIFERLRTSGDRSDLNAAVTIYSEVIAKICKGSVKHAAALNNPATALHT